MFFPFFRRNHRKKEKRLPEPFKHPATLHSIGGSATDAMASASPSNGHNLRSDCDACQADELRTCGGDNRREHAYENRGFANDSWAPRDRGTGKSEEIAQNHKSGIMERNRTESDLRGSEVGRVPNGRGQIGVWAKGRRSSKEFQLKRTVLFGIQSNV
jgi:hypothetical protein